MPPTPRTLHPHTLRAFRHWLGLSQEDVGCILGLSAGAIQDMEYKTGGPEWARYALLGWAVMVHGQAPRSAARYLGLPWRHYPPPLGAPTSAADLAALDAIASGAAWEDAPNDSSGDAEAGRPAGPPPAAEAGLAGAADSNDGNDGDDSDANGDTTDAGGADLEEAEEASSAAPAKHPIPGALVRAVREEFGLTRPRDLAAPLRCGTTTVWRAETHGAPQWMALALGGLGVARFGRDPGPMASRLGIPPDAGPYRRPDEGTPEGTSEVAPQATPPRSPVLAAVQCLAPPGAGAPARRRTRGA